MLTVSNHDKPPKSCGSLCACFQVDRFPKTTSSVVSRRPRRTSHQLALHTFAPRMVTNATNPTRCALLWEIYLRRNPQHWHLCDHSQRHPSYLKPHRPHVPRLPPYGTGAALLR
jgi:hypothetical protein